MKTKLLTIALAVLAMSSSMLPARTIDWGGAVNGLLYTSYGAPLDATFTFELGTFGDTFIPTEFNMAQWEANWKVFDRAVAPALNGWDPATQFFSGTATMQTNGTSSESPPLPAYTFNQGEQAYIWVYNTLTVAALSEWALVTNNSLDGNALDDWTMPAHADQTQQPLEWRLSNATGVPFGGLNDVEGPGQYSVTPPAFDLQTHVVPEPASALLVGIAGLFAMRRRRGRQSI